MAEIQSEGYLLHTREIVAVTALADDGTETMVIQGEGRCSSDSFVLCVRANIKD